MSIRSFHRFLAFRYEISDPTQFIHVEKGGSRLPVVASREEIERILSSFEDTPQGLFDQCLLETLYGLGLRVSELCSLKTSQINLDERFVTILGKGDKERIIPLPEQTAQLLRRYYKATMESKKIAFFLYQSFTPNGKSRICATFSKEMLCISWY